MGEGAMSALATVASGDMRRAITLLQSAARFNQNVLTAEVLYEAAGVVPGAEIADLVAVCAKSTFSDVERKVKSMISDSYPLGQVLSQVQDYLVASKDVEDDRKARICVKFAQVDKRIADGANEALQLLDAVGFVHQTLHQR